MRNCSQPLLKNWKVRTVTIPAVRYITNSSMPLPSKMSSGSRQITYTGSTTRFRKKARRYRANTGYGIRYMYDGAKRSIRKVTTADSRKTNSRYRYRLLSLNTMRLLRRIQKYSSVTSTRASRMLPRYSSTRGPL